MLEFLFGPSDVVMGIFGAIVGGIGSLLGKAVGGAASNAGSIAASGASIAADKYMLEKKHQFSKHEAEKARQFQTGERVAQQSFSAQQAAKQMGFQERMASTQTQRATKDLEAAGLNRILALGQPAIAPQGAMASASQPSGATARSSSANEGTNAVARGIQLMSAKQAVELQKAHTFKTLEEGRAAGASADRTEAMTVPFTMMMDALGRSGGAAKELRGYLDKLQKATGGDILDVMKEAQKAGTDLFEAGKEKINTIRLRRGRHKNDLKENWED